MELRDLAISPQLEALLRKVKDVKPVHTPRQNITSVDSKPIPEYDESDLPTHINSYPFSKYVGENFNDASQWGLLSNVLRSALTRTVASKDEKVAIAMNRMILRFMIDKSLTGADSKLFCDYFIARLLINYHMRDEALCQIASLTWKNYDEDKRKRLWILMSNCLSCIIPTPRLYNYLLKYVSDHGTDGERSILQHKILRMPRNQSEEEGRLYPPAILEWQTNNLIAPMAVTIHLPNNSTVTVEVNSWSTAEDVANRAIESVIGGTAQGWSLMLSRDKVMTEMSGHDYLFDLISKMEVFPGLETQHDGFISYGPGLQRQPSFSPSELLDSRPAMNYQREVPVDVPHDPMPDNRNPQAGIDPNFSFGPPNIRLSNNAQRRLDQNIDPETGGMARRIKGGGRMMNGMGMPMQPQMMMQQPQMMPMQGMTQQPMMQQPMMQQPMMQQSMMQQPMMQQPMMQQPMMQQPMMQQPMMQQPMMQQPMMQQPMMQQPMMQQPMMQAQMPMRMPGSIGMIANSMDTPAEQALMLRQMKSWIKQQEENQKKSEDARRHRNFRNHDDDYRRSRRHDRYRDSSSEEDKRSSRRHKERRDSSEEDRRRSDRRKSRHDSGSYDRRKPSYGSYDRKKQESGSIETKKQDQRISRNDDNEEKKLPVPVPIKEPKKEKVVITLPKSKKDAPPKKPVPVTDTDESESANDFGNGQGTVRMSFKQKRNFFEQKNAQIQSAPPPRKGRPKVIPLPKSEEKTVPRAEKKADDPKPEPPQPPVTDPEQEAENTHLEALKLVEAAKKKSQKEAKTKNKDVALLAMQRRNAAARQKNATETKSIDEEDPPYEPSAAAKMQPKRMTTAKPKPLVIPAQDLLDSSSEDSPQEYSREATKTALELALMARRRNEQRSEERSETSQDRIAPPLPPPIQESRAPPLPPPIEDETSSGILRELSSDQNTRTVLHPLPKTAPKIYKNVNWKLHVRKEIFMARDHVKNDEMYQFLFIQVAREAMNGNPRIITADQDHVKEQIPTGQKKDISTATKKTLVKNAMEKWPAYFTRIFTIKVTETDPGLPNTLYQANSIGVGMTGVHFILIHASSKWKLQSYHFNSISQVKEHGTIIVFQIDGKRVVISCRKSIELGRTMRPYMIDPGPMPILASPRNARQESEEPEEPSFQDSQLEKKEEIYEVSIPPENSNLTLLQYGERYFAKKKDVAKALSFSKGTLSKPLHEISDQAMAADSLKCYKAIQQFMGDVQAKSKPEQQIKEVIGICNKHRQVVIDEVTIYLAKQTTNNIRSESLIKGWRLFAVFLAFYKCSDLLLPYLQAHLYNVSRSEDETSQGGAKVCQVNLQKTLDYGGRRHTPSNIEIKTLLKGYVTAEQSFFSPGMGDMKFQMNTSSVIEDAIRYFCGLLGIKSEDGIKEYGVFMIIMNMDDEMVDMVPQLRRTYLLDIMSMAAKKNHKIWLIFQRVVWKQQINYDNENLVLALFHQAIGEYADGKSLTYEELTENSTRAQIAEYSKLSGLIHRGQGESSLPSIEQVKFYIPQKVAGVQSDFVWKESVHNDFMSIQQMTPAAARSEVLALLSNKRMFGSNIFTVELDSGNNQMTQRKMIAINPTHLLLMDCDNHRIERKVALSEIEDVTPKGSGQGRMAALDINIIRSSPLKLKSQKAAVIKGVLDHHIHI